MPVDKAVLQQLIDELPLTKPEDKTYLFNMLSTDDAAGTQFVGQRLRHSDYTKKTTDLTTREKTLADKANESVRTYATQLAEAQTKLREVMTQLGEEQISTTRAKALLNKVKTTYNLSDEDIPKLDNDGVVKPGTGGGLDEARVRTMMDEFQNDLLKKLAPINSFPMIPVLINEIQHEHQTLTGTRLPESKIRELMNKSSQEGGPSLKAAWEDEFKIGDLRVSKQKESWKAENRKEWEDEQTKLRSEAALRGVRRADGQTTSLSPVMSKKFAEHVDSTNSEMVKARDAGDVQARQNGPKMSGAERAAASYVARREAGIPMGAEAPTK